MNTTIDPTQSNINQADYLKLFMQELTYQDPLKPIDNREFMAQMAQFSALQEAQATNKTLEILTAMSIGTRCLMLLGKKVTLNGTNQEGTVSKIEFPLNGLPLIHVLTADSNQRVQLADIAAVA